MSDKIPVAPTTLLHALQVVSEGGLTRRDTGPNGLAAAPTFGRVQQCMNRNWVREVGGVFCITDTGRTAMELAELELQGMTLSQARLLVAVSQGQVVQVDHDTKVAVNDRGRHTWHLAPAVPVYLDRKYGLAELKPGQHVWSLTAKGEQAVKLLADIIPA